MARVAAITAGRVGALGDFSDRLSAGERKPFRGKRRLVGYLPGG
jgi:hypothetical protein